MTTAKSRQTFLVEKMEKKLLQKFNIALNLKWEVEWTSTVFPNASTCLVWYLFLFLINCKHLFNDLPCFPHEMVIDYKVWIHVINIVDLLHLNHYSFCLYHKSVFLGGFIISSRLTQCTQLYVCMIHCSNVIWYNTIYLLIYTSTSICKCTGEIY